MMTEIIFVRLPMLESRTCSVAITLSMQHPTPRTSMVVVSNRSQSCSSELTQVGQSLVRLFNLLLKVYRQTVCEGAIEGRTGSDVLQTQPEQRAHTCGKSERSAVSLCSVVTPAIQDPPKCSRVVPCTLVVRISDCLNRFCGLPPNTTTSASPTDG